MSLPRPSPRIASPAAATPGGPPTPEVKAICFTCGSQTFSTTSKMRVRKYVYNCPPTPGLFSITTQEWPYDSNDSDEWRWENDANNWAVRQCGTNNWIVSVDNVGYEGTCPTPIGPRFLLSLGLRWELFMNVGSSTVLLATGEVINNSCIPSVPA
jgi:hypothetical protein